MRRIAALGSLVLACSTGSGARQDGGPGDGATMATDGGSLPPEDAALADTSLADAAEEASAPAALNTELTVTGVSFFQTVRVGLAQNGAPVAQPNAPVVAGKGGVLRVYVSPAGAAPSGPVTAELLLDDGVSPVTLRDTRTLTGASADDNPQGLFAFALGATQVTPATRWSVRLLGSAGAPTPVGTAHPARLPRDGTSAALNAQDDAGGVRLVLIPVRWTGDGSNRLPDTSAAQLDLYRTVLRTLYPLTRVDLTVRAPIDFGRTTLTGNVDFGALNQTLTNLRTTDNAPADAYYYALVSAAADYNAYCRRSCVTGQSFVVNSPTDSSVRVGGGVGFTGEGSAWTLAHELGHQHGRTHAPCGTSSSDPLFPYAGAHLGVWGFDARSGTFLAPSPAVDFMSYCDPQWVSDYTYSALFTRILAVHGVRPREASAPASLRFLRVQGAEASWGERAVLTAPPEGVPAQLRVLDAAGRTLLLRTVATFELSHDEGARWALVPAELVPGASALELDGVRLSVR